MKRHGWNKLTFSSVHSVVSDSLQPHKPQHTKPPCPSPTPRAYPNSCPLSRWCHPAISSSVVPFSSHLQSFPASESFPMSQFFTSGGQSIGVSASTSVLPMITQDWSPLGWLSLQSRGLLIASYHYFSLHPIKKHVMSVCPNTGNVKLNSLVKLKYDPVAQFKVNLNSTVAKDSSKWTV